MFFTKSDLKGYCTKKKKTKREKKEFWHIFFYYYFSFLRTFLFSDQKFCSFFSFLFSVLNHTHCTKLKTS